tara:strand:- start:5433 stop:6284 length:852 start_codon:yes stop_codon:yes gene_type:complete
MQVLENIADLKKYLQLQANAGFSVALVPTMGNLHEGHMALIDAAAIECDIVLATLFINPTQFGPNEDFEKYPRSYEADKELLASHSCDVLFAPSVSEMYPRGLTGNTLIKAAAIAEKHCGASRPGHFDGVCSVVCKLLNLVNPDKVLFGKKDYQQLHIIKTMVKDLFIPVEIIGIETKRDNTGLALSSRNSYLSQAQKQQASILYQTLQQTAQLLTSDKSTTFSEMENTACTQISNAGLRPDYFTICNAHSLLPATKDDQQLVILCAAYLGETRLIDNISVTL